MLPRNMNKSSSGHLAIHLIFPESKKPKQAGRKAHKSRSMPLMRDFYVHRELSFFFFKSFESTFFGAFSLLVIIFFFPLLRAAHNISFQSWLVFMIGKLLRYSWTLISVNVQLIDAFFFPLNSLLKVKRVKIFLKECDDEL